MSYAISTLLIYVLNHMCFSVLNCRGVGIGLGIDHVMLQSSASLFVM